MADPPKQTFEEKRLDAARALVGQDRSLQKLEEFAKAILGSAALVGSIGAGLQVSGLTALSDDGRKWFTWAVVALAISLILSVFTLLPLARRVNRYDLEDMERKLGWRIRIRTGLTTAAALFFAGALALAAYAGKVSQENENDPARTPALSYTLGEEGALSAAANFDNADSGTTATLNVRLVPHPPGTIDPSTSGVVDRNGDLTLNASAIPSERTRRFKLKVVYVKDGTQLTARRRVEVRVKPARSKAG